VEEKNWEINVFFTDIAMMSDTLLRVKGISNKDHVIEEPDEGKALMSGSPSRAEEATPSLRSTIGSEDILL